ncbi:MAG TPA: hypothetical protein VN282_07840 [Pyrinomonadaceae bacterium]|nr:hypothetical protein [Pyrinomonadaceae bacterium]
MLRRAFAIMISGILCCSAIGYGPARAQSQGADRPAEKARAEVQKLGVNPQRRVEVKLQDGTKYKGSISAAGQDNFTITDAKTGAPRTVAYADVEQVKKPGGGLSARSWIIIGAAAAAAVIVGTTVLYPVLCDGGAGC